MSSRRALRARRHARFLQQGNLERELAEHLHSGEHGEEFTSYRAWLLAAAQAQGRGGRMRRALIQAQQRYDKLKPARIRASQVRRGYPRKWR